MCCGWTSILLAVYLGVGLQVHSIRACSNWIETGTNSCSNQQYMRISSCFISSLCLSIFFFFPPHVVISHCSFDLHFWFLLVFSILIPFIVTRFTLNDFSILRCRCSLYCPTYSWFWWMPHTCLRKKNLVWGVVLYVC